MTPVEASTSLGRFVEAVKDLPAWLFSAFATAAGLLLFVPAINADLPKTFKPWLVIGTVLFGVLALFKWVSVLIEFWRSARVAANTRKTFHLTPLAQHCYWSVAKQPDGSVVTHLVAEFAVKNQSTSPIGLIRARVTKPAIKGEVLHDVIMVRAQHSSMRGTAIVSDHRIAAGTALPASAMVLIRGKPRQSEAKDLEVTFGITDEDGREQRVRVICKARPKPKTGAPPVTLESLHSITDPIEKDVAAVLQSELSRYEKNGRSAGGLGSLHLIARGIVMNQFSTDSWTPNSAINEEIVDDPEQTELRSDNLDALLALHARLSSDDEREQLVNTMLGRLNEDKGYARVSYFIVCALWKLGMLSEALNAALFGLSENDIKDFGLGNTLMMLNGLLRYRHPDFTSEMLDAIQRLLDGSQEHPFRIPQKIAAVRARRLVQPAQESTTDLDDS